MFVSLTLSTCTWCIRATLFWLACHAIVTVGDSGVCCYVPLMYLWRQSDTITFLRVLITSLCVAIASVCVLVTFLCVLITSLCVLITSLWVLITPLCELITSLCVLMTSRCVLITSLCVLITSTFVKRSIVSFCFKWRRLCRSSAVHISLHWHSVKAWALLSTQRNGILVPFVPSVIMTSVYPDDVGEPDWHQTSAVELGRSQVSSVNVSVERGLERKSVILIVV